ncbi:MAG: ABC transporter ATP-binding protein [candidate division WOR-3 bacterium]|nr:MAG: ABC transporter ATP-binding protein [candidate division WOR-3 bacterium]
MLSDSDLVTKWSSDQVAETDTGVLDAQPASPLTEPRPLLCVRDLWRTYRRGSEEIHALAGVGLDLRPGEIVSIVGRSGSGKTTMLNQVGCLDRPSSGSILVDGTDVTRLREKDLVAFRRDHIGFIFQLFYLIPTLTVEENIRLPLVFARRQDDERVDELIERVGLTKERRSLPKQLDGGAMQRVAIARALINRPRILLADEPTGRLEKKSRAAVLDIFRELATDGLAILMATHDLEQAGEADRIIEFSDGKVVRETQNRRK